MAISSSKLMKHGASVALLVAGLIHLLPVSGVFGTASLFRLYGIEVPDPNMAILLQHRALLFGILGVLMLIAIPSATPRGDTEMSVAKRRGRW